MLCLAFCSVCFLRQCFSTNIHHSRWSYVLLINFPFRVCLFVCLFLFVCCPNTLVQTYIIHFGLVYYSLSFHFVCFFSCFLYFLFVCYVNTLLQTDITHNGLILFLYIPLLITMAFKLYLDFLVSLFFFIYFYFIILLQTHITHKGLILFLYAVLLIITRLFTFCLCFQFVCCFNVSVQTDITNDGLILFMYVALLIITLCLHSTFVFSLFAFLIL